FDPGLWAPPARGGLRGREARPRLRPRTQTAPGAAHPRLALPSPDDHDASRPDRGVSAAALGRTRGAGGRPCVGNGVVAPSCGGHLIPRSTPDDHPAPRPHPRVIPSPAPGPPPPHARPLFRPT